MPPKNKKDGNSSRPVKLKRKAYDEHSDNGQNGKVKNIGSLS